MSGDDANAHREAVLARARETLARLDRQAQLDVLEKQQREAAAVEEFDVAEYLAMFPIRLY